MDETFWDSNGDAVLAAIALIVAVGLAIAVDRFLIGRAEEATEQLDTGQFSRGARTRLRVIRRLVFLAIILVGIVVAISQLTEIRRFANLLLGSTAVVAAIIGFAGRTVIANFVAGVLMAITQPIRIGDRIAIGEEVRGRVTDVALTYTSVDAGDGAVTIVPNEKIVTEVVVNRSTGHSKAPVLAEVWVPRDADLEAARGALEGTEVTSVRVAELTGEGARLELRASMEGGRDRESREADLREHAQAALRTAGVLSPPGYSSTS
jgi:small-conductance mechanosensitive channel